MYVKNVIASEAKYLASDGQELAVKVLVSPADSPVKVDSSAGVADDKYIDKQFSVHAKIKHPDTMQLLGQLGYCRESGKEEYGKHGYMALGFEYMHNGNLHHYLHGAMLLEIT